MAQAGNITLDVKVSVTPVPQQQAALDDLRQRLDLVPLCEQHLYGQGSE